MTEILKKIASNTLKRVPSGEAVEIQSLWKDNTAVFYFLRRFGCPVCQYLARQLSKIKPQLDENQVKLIGIGPEELGSKEFYEAKNFDGELYYDPEKETYKDLQYKRYNVLTVVGAAIDSKVRQIANLASKEGIQGNMKGDLMQTGGLLIVKKGGEEVLLNFKQASAGDYVENQKILDALGIEAKAPEATSTGPSCNEDVCTM